MKNSILFICLSLVLFSCGSSGSSSGYQEQSFEHLEAVFYPLYDNFTIEEGAGDFKVKPDNHLTGDKTDFIATLEAKLIDAGFSESDIGIKTIYDSNDPNVYKVHAVVRVSTGELFTCDLEGIRQTFV